MQYYDVTITNFLTGLIPHSIVTDTFFTLISYERSLIIIWFLFVAFYLLFIEKRDKVFLIHFISAMVVSFVASNIILKNIIQKIRPIPSLASTFICPTDFSFPSSHAAVSFSCAYILSYFDPKRRFIYYGAAVLISFSRIYLYCHFFFDILGGAILGLLISYLIIRWMPSRYTNHQ